MIARPVRRSLLLGAVVFSCVLAAFAQDAGQVLRTSVGFNTLRNSTALSDERRGEIDKLAKLAQAANAAGKFGDALKHYYHGIALLRGNEWTPLRALESSLTLKLDHAVIEPSQTVQVRAGQLFALDAKPEGPASAAIKLLKMTGDEPVKVLKIIEAVDADFIASPLAAEVLIPDVADGNYRLALTLAFAGGAQASRTVTVRIERGLAARFAAARARLAKVEAELKARRRDTLLAQLPSVAYRISLFDLAARAEVAFERINFGEELKETTAMLDALEAGRDPLAAKRGDFRKAYTSKADNTLQPYRIFVPASYDRSKRYPLIIALHGMGGDENSYFDLYANGAFKVEAEKRGYIVACPKGRQPASMYRGPAEADVMDVISEVERDYKIDPDRVYLTGHSMGGFGTWSVAINHPDIFAALAPVAGGGLPANMSKIAHIAQLVVHGDADKTVPVASSRVMVDAAKKLGAEVRYIEVPGGTHVDVVVPTFKDVFDWFDSHRRKVADEKLAAPAARSNYN
ncbi:MAG TPA: prolyl oligopeptidase family serine peptidase [Blastocatellia bacterium]|nr:prolyl oligopeptidase family serine peptidase [Blastocatellia bacterium]